MTTRQTYVAFSIGLAVLLAGSTGFAQNSDSGRVRIGIGTIEYQAPDPSRRAAQDTRAFVDMLTTALVRTGKFDLIERQRMESILQEQQMGSAGLTDGYDVLRLGGLDYLVIGAITQFGATVERAPFLSLDTVRSRMTMAVDIRLVDVENGLTAIADTVAVEMDGDGDTDEYELRRRLDAQRTVLLGDVMRAVAMDITWLIVSQAHPIRVAAATAGGEIILNYGSGLLTSGLILHVYSEGESFTDPATGEILGSEERLVARISVARTEDRFSRAQVLAEYSPIEPGMIARIIDIGGQ